MYDLIIVGGGPAGLTAGIFAGRNGLKTLILNSPEHPSQMTYALTVENFPSIKSIQGPKLLESMKEHATSVGCEYISETALDFRLKKKIKTVITSEHTFKAKAVIIATGAQHRKAGVPGEDRLIGKGVSYCPTCDAPFFKGKKTLVIGGSNAAISGALQLKDVGSDVKIVNTQDDMRADKVWMDRLHKSKIPVIQNSVLNKIIGDNKVEGVFITSNKTGKTTKIQTNGVFIMVGEVPTTNLAKKAGIKIEKESIKTDDYRRTNIKGVFAAGDVHQCPYKQIVIACASGAIASMSAYDYIKAMT